MANSKQYILSLFPDNNNNEISAADIRIFVNAIFDEEIDTVDIIDNLFSTDGRVPLSANQGRILDDKITQTVVDIDSKEDSLGLGSNNQVLSIDINNNKIWRTLDTVNEVTVYNGLDSVSTTAALSANMGRVLDELIGNLNANVVGNTANISTNTSAINTSISNITLNRSDIDVNIANIGTNANNIGVNAANINTNTNDITTIQDDITNRVDVNISQNASDITTNTSNILSNTSSIAINVNDISLLDGRVTVNETDIAALQALNGGVDLSGLQTQVNLNTARIDTNENNITTNATNIGLNQAAIGTNATSIGVNSSNISTNATNIANNRTDINTNTNRITVNEGEISLLDGRVTINESSIASNLAKINTNETGISDNRDLINNNIVAISQNTTDIFNNKQDIEVLQTQTSDNANGIASNFVLTENNRENILNLNQELTATNTAVSANALEISNKENYLDAPDNDNMVLGSLTDGTRVWLDNALSEQTFTVIDNLDSTSADDALSANQGRVLDEKIEAKEDYLELPRLDGMILTSTQLGVRTWVEANVLNVDYGAFFGAGFQLLRISIFDNIGGTLDNTSENASRQLTATATYNNGTGTPEVTVDATNDVNWTSSNIAAYTINDGIGGGVVNAITQTVSGSSYTSIPVTAELTVNGTTVNSSINISIDNTPIVNTITVTPNPLNITGAGNSLQATAIATYTHNNWTNSPTNITNTSTWLSDNLSVATVNVSGLVTSVALGTALVTATISPSVINTQGVATVNVTA